MIRIDAVAAQQMFPKVVGHIFGADLWSGFAILDMGVGAHAVMVAGKLIACCPSYSHARRAGEKLAAASLAHAYDLEVLKDGKRSELRVNAKTRTAAAASARQAGYSVMSVNMIG